MVVVLPSPAGVGVIAETRISLPFGLSLQRLDVIHRHLGLVVAERFEVLRRDAELFACDVDDRSLFGGLGDGDVGERLLVLGGGHWARSTNAVNAKSVVMPAKAGIQYTPIVP